MMVHSEIVILLCGILTYHPYTGQESKKFAEHMVLIPAGEFLMGKNQPGVDYRPARLVRVDAFYMDRHEVTNADYLKFCQQTGHRYPEFWNTDNFLSGENYPEYPVVGISWADAAAYASWAGKRLPTEAEWEYAARGGLAGMDFPNGNKPSRGNQPLQASNWTSKMEKVGKAEPNGFGLYDMDGNVWEWVADWYAFDYYETGEGMNPSGPATGRFRVIRGGSWHSGAMCRRVYFRSALSANWCDFAVGFRCVRDLE